MGWFNRRSAPGSHTALLRGSDSKAAGAAVLLSSARVLTCAHVVNDALGREPLSTEQPGTDLAFAVSFRGGDAAAGVTARLSLWLPPQKRSGSPVWGGDLAVLELDEPAPDWTRPVVWRDMVEGMELRAWHGGGAAITYADTVAGPQDAGCRYLDGALTGAAIGPGYSGGPLWVRSDFTVAGLAVAQVMTGAPALRAQDTVRRGWAVPWQTVREEMTRAGAGDVVAECQVVRRGHTSGPCEASVQAMVPVLRTLLDDPARRTDHCRELLYALGCDASAGGTQAPTLDELATALLVGAQRANAAPILVASHYCAGTVVLAAPHSARQFDRVDTIRIGASLDELDTGGPAGAADLRRWSAATTAGLVRRDGVFTWVTGPDAQTDVRSTDGTDLPGRSIAVLDVPSLALATDAPDIRFDFAVGESAGRRCGAPASIEVRIDLEGAGRGGAPISTSRHLVHPAGQRPLTATGIALGVERLLGLHGEAVAPGIHTPEALIDPAYAVERMAETGAAST